MNTMSCSSVGSPNLLARPFGSGLIRRALGLGRKIVADARARCEKVRERVAALSARVARPMRTIWSSFTDSTPALPIDLFRILVGLLSCVYFLRTFREARDFSNPHGLIDHRLLRQICWYTRLCLFHPSLGLNVFRALYLLAAGGSLLLAAGIHTRPVAAFLFLTAVSTYRWNFLVTYLDDAMMHLMLLWMLLLPIGRTLTLREWWSQRRAAVTRWKEARVPGAAVRCFLANLMLAYLVAGLWKWSSPLWRQGLAVYAGLKTAVAYTPDRWSPAHLPVLIVANHIALVLEPLFPLIFILPANHPLKWALAIAMFGFHAGIIATLKIPFANTACIMTLVIAFRHEIMRRVGAGVIQPDRPDPADGVFDLPARFASGLVAVLSLAALTDVARPQWRSGTHPQVRQQKQWANQVPGMRQNPVYGILWCAGVAQSYRLFDWIDERNYHITYDVIERRRDGTWHRLPDTDLFPRTQRHVLLQSYLHDVMWMKLPRNRLAEVQRSLFESYARRYCWQCGDTGRIQAVANVQRTTARNLELRRPRRIRFLEFTCENGSPDLHFTRLVTD